MPVYWLASKSCIKKERERGLELALQAHERWMHVLKNQRKRYGTHKKIGRICS
jgi:hypothetical protein